MIERLIVTALSKRQTQELFILTPRLEERRPLFAPLFTAQWLHAQEKT